MEGFQRDGAEFAKNNKFTDHFRTSAKTGNSIDEAVRQVAKNVRELHRNVTTLAM